MPPPELMNYQQDLRLIKLVQKYPCIWNTNLEEYKISELRADAWENITKKCGLSNPKEARAHWKRLRDCHRLALSRNKNKNRKYDKKWKYEDAMSFVVPFIGARPKYKSQPFEISVDSINDEDDEVEYLEYDTEDNQTDSNQDMESDKTDARNSIDDISFVSNNKRKGSDLHIPEKLIRFDVVDESLDDDHNNIVNSTHDMSNRALEKFFSSMFETTSSLPERLQVKIQRRVFNAVMEAQEEYLAVKEIEESCEQ